MTLYPVTDSDEKRIDNNFKYHAPIIGQAEKYEEIRLRAKAFAYMLINFCPPSRELSLALTELENAVMWANAAIARNEKAETEIK